MTANNYSIVGRVIDGHQAPMPGLLVRIQQGTEKPLAETKTDDQGRFALSLDRGQVNRSLGGLRRAAKVALAVARSDGHVLYTTRETPLLWQLEFRVFLRGGEGVPEAPDLYSGSMRRMMGGMRSSGVSGRAMKSMGKSGAKEPGTEPGAWERVAGVLQDYGELSDSVNMMFGALDGVMGDATRASPARMVVFDGPQVPRRAWAQADNQAIIWPRKEPFKWE